MDREGTDRESMDRAIAALTRAVERLARLIALAGGLVLCALVLLTCLSIAGRSLGTVLNGDAVQAIAPGLADRLLALGVGSIKGDFELVEAGMAFAIFAFLPLCQLRGGHASVDLFVARLPPRGRAVLRAVIETVFALVLVLIAWQLLGGTLSRLRTGQTTFLLEFPLWWAFAASLFGAATTALVAIYVAGVRIAEAVTGRTLLAVGATP